ncbi:MAG: hypothetical protein OXD48_07470, partial [Litoreibacter sp.]|nr:hypothetical protein [Litoreibacter sp.]
MLTICLPLRNREAVTSFFGIKSNCFAGETMTKFLTTAAFIAGAFAATATTAATFKHTAAANRNGVENANFVYNEDNETFKPTFPKWPSVRHQDRLIL